MEQQQSRAELAADMVAEAIERTHEQNPGEGSELRLTQACKDILQDVLRDGGWDPTAGALNLAFDIVDGELRAAGVMRLRTLPNRPVDAIAMDLRGDVTWKDGQIVRSDPSTS